MRSLSSKSRLDKDVIYDLKWIHKHYYLYNVNGGPPVLMPPLQEALAMNGLAPGQPISRALPEKPDTALMNIEFRRYSLPSPDKQSQKVSLVSLFVITNIHYLKINLN